MAKTEKELIKLYGGEVEIEFYPNSHLYKKDGELLTSVTGATSVMDKSGALLNWAEKLANLHVADIDPAEKFEGYQVKELVSVATHQYAIVKKEAASIGDLVHDFAKRFALWQMKQGDKPKIEDWPKEAMNGINGFLDWFNSYQVIFSEVEQVVYSLKYRYVGRYDLLATIDGNLTILDYKTSKSIYPEAYYQISAYEQAWNEAKLEKIDGRQILHFQKDTGEFHVHEISDKDAKKDFRGFLNCLKLKNDLKRRAKNETT
jgi:hypothetical protein